MSEREVLARAVRKLPVGAFAGPSYVVALGTTEDIADAILAALADSGYTIVERAEIERLASRPDLDVERLARAMDAADPSCDSPDTWDAEDHAEHVAYAKDIAHYYAALATESAAAVSLPTHCSVCGRRILTNRQTGKCWKHRATERTEP